MATNNDILKKEMLAALEKSLGIVSSAAKVVGIARSTHYDWMQQDEEYKKKVEELSNIALDFAESQLFQSIKNGSDTATIFLLKTKGKSRGYVERTEQSQVNKDGEDVKPTILVYNGQEIKL
jgi:hypothetical protein